MKKKLIIAIWMAVILSHAGAVFAQFDKNVYMDSMRTRKVLHMGMTECVMMALENNSEIQIKKITPLIAGAEVLKKRAEFEPSLGFDYMMDDATDLSDTPLFGPNPTKLKVNTFNFGYDQKFLTGTEVALDFYNSRKTSNYDVRYQALNPVFDSFAVATITQPLLRGFGVEVNKAGISIAKNNKLKSLKDFVQEVIVVLTNVKKTYYDFQYSQEQYKTAVVSLKRVEDLYNIIIEKYAKGLSSNVDILQSESEVARFEQAVAAAEGAMKSAEDGLKFITNIVNDEKLWNADIILMDEIGYEKKDIDIMSSLSRAFENRPDYAAAKLELKNKDISVMYYKNSLLPIVDLFGSYGLNGLGKNYEKDMGHLGSGKYEDWSFGVKVKVPLENQEARGNYNKSVYEKEQAIIGFKRLEQKIIMEVRNAVRDVSIKYRMLEASIKNLDAEVKNYEAQTSRFAAGLVSTHDIIDYQEKLARAEINYAQSVIDYNKAFLDLAKVEGTTLINDNIKVE